MILFRFLSAKPGSAPGQGKALPLPHLALELPRSPEIDAMIKENPVLAMTA